LAACLVAARGERERESERESERERKRKHIIVWPKLLQHVMSMRPPITLPLLQRVSQLVAEPMEKAFDRAEKAIAGSIDVVDQIQATLKASRLLREQAQRQEQGQEQGQGHGQGQGPPSSESKRNGKSKGKDKGKDKDAAQKGPPSSESKRTGKSKGKDKGKDKDAAQKGPPFDARSRSPPALRGTIALDGKGSPPTWRDTIANEGKGNAKGLARATGKYYDLVADALRGPNANAAHAAAARGKGDGTVAADAAAARGTVAAHAAAARGKGDGTVAAHATAALRRPPAADPAFALPVYVPPGRALSPPGEWSV
jgi:hypothetical protein